MIVSYHPCFEADKNLLCAGRQPNEEDLAEIKSASAVILPQGCYKSLYEMVRTNCRHVFPNYDVRFGYEGKIGQIRLFREIGIAHPKTEIYLNVKDYYRSHGNGCGTALEGFPLVLKFNWGGEGQHVYLVDSSPELFSILKIAEAFETKSGLKGFVIQEFVQSRNRSLRVIVIGQTVISYWRIQKNSQDFRSSLAKGAVIDNDIEPELKERAVTSVKYFCRLTDINLAAFDLLFSDDGKNSPPLFLEINYFFGRRGLGGSEKFYALLVAEIIKWIKTIGLSLSCTY